MTASLRVGGVADDCEGPVRSAEIGEIIGCQNQRMAVVRSDAAEIDDFDALNEVISGRVGIGVARGSQVPDEIVACEPHGVASAAAVDTRVFRKAQTGHDNQVVADSAIENIAASDADERVNVLDGG